MDPTNHHLSKSWMSRENATLSRKTSVSMFPPVDVSPETPFESEHQPIAVVLHPDQDVSNHAALQDVVHTSAVGPNLMSRLPSFEQMG